jgi:hypothetical protein
LFPPAARVRAGRRIAETPQRTALPGTIATANGTRTAAGSRDTGMAAAGEFVDCR